MERWTRKLLLEASKMTLEYAKGLKSSEMTPEGLISIIRGLRDVADSLEAIVNVMLMQRAA